jgi:hypothetical protein
MTESASARTFALADVEKHNKPDDIWLVIHNKGEMDCVNPNEGARG